MKKHQKIPYNPLFIFVSPAIFQDDCLEDFEDLYKTENLCEKLNFQKFQAKNQEEEYNLSLWIR